ncbi:hypothetical protein LARV_01757 [Longilinea arvoryzae]|uniref:Uncharacterized protein n=1 Tax=Longilinea arvoryzae TaxID=360412 RepID=A0A0S7BEM2_9CHLR|nr:hypothetical protein [Longilinea arvoryzae]GAP13997.1 hypothetical protein LARV_01757 [Longilinea arvoryzae]
MNYADSRSTFDPFSALRRLRFRPGLLTGGLIIGALLAFEIFNYSTTDYALRDLLGDLRFAGMRWATILAVAFCGIDFAGIARLFTPEQGAEEPKEVWYLFGAWLLAATMNAGLTWWGISMAIVNHSLKSTAVIDTNTLTKVIPVFVALMVWVIRILIIGTLSVAGDRLFGTNTQRPYTRNARNTGIATNAQPVNLANAAPAHRPSSFSSSLRQAANHAEPAPRPEPTYHSVSMTPQAHPSHRPNHVENTASSGVRRF